MEHESVWMQDLSWRDVERYLDRKESPTVLVPIGSTEQHGPHLPLGTDAYQAIDLAEAIAEEADVLATPPLWLGDAHYHMAFPGTISLSPETLVHVLGDVYESLASHGFENVITVNGHRLGNNSAIDIASRQAKEAFPETYFALLDPLRFGVHLHRELRDGDSDNGLHGGEFETSFMQFKHPELVDEAEFVREVEDHFSAYQSLLLIDLLDTVRAADSHHADPSSTPGHKGDPTLASAEKGQKLFDGLVANGVAFLADLERYRTAESG